MSTRSNSLRNTPLYQKKFNPGNDLIIEAYQIGEQLGKGGFAHVYQIKKKNDPQIKAVKVISRMDKHGKQDPRYLQKIQSQIKIMQAASETSDNIVKYLHSFNDNENTYIIMELCSLGSLSDISKKRKILSQPETRFFAVQMIRTLISLKEKNIIHRDIKLANYFVTQDFQLKLGDFGLATFNDDVFKNKPNVCGTPNYLAPEVIEKRLYSFEVDLWATGVIIFTLLFGVPPFETKSCKETYDKIKKCSYKFEGITKHIKVSDEAKMFIRDILQLDPKKRISLNEMMSHPFLSNFPIPLQLQPECSSSSPSQHFLKKYSKHLNPQSISVQSVTKANNSQTILQKKQKPKTKQMYKNILKTQIIKIEDDKTHELKARLEELELIKKDSVLKQQNYITWKGDIGDTPRKREREERENSPSVKKRFKYNVEPIQETQEPELTATMAKNYLQKSEDYYQTDFILTDKNLLQMINQRKNQESFSRQKFKLKEIRPNRNFIKLTPEQVVITWHEISEKNGLLYKLSSNRFGALFPDRYKVLISHPSKVQYIDSEEIKIQNENRNYNYSILQERIAYLNHHFSKLNQGEKSEPQPKKNIQPIFVTGYSLHEDITIFEFNNGDVQFTFADGFILLVHQRRQIVCYYDHTKNKFDLPIDISSIESARIQEKIRKIINYLQNINQLNLINVQTRKSVWNWNQPQFTRITPPIRLHAVSRSRNQRDKREKVQLKQ